MLPLVVALAASVAASPDWYAPFRSHSRVLLVFAPSGADPNLLAQRRSLRAGSAGSRERDLVVVEVVAERADDTRVGGSAARRAYGVPESEFCVLLVGKDGGEKLRQKHPISEESLFATIDAMPMRQDEMSRDGKTR